LLKDFEEADQVYLTRTNKTQVRINKGVFLFGLHRDFGYEKKYPFSKSPKITKFLKKYSLHNKEFNIKSFLDWRRYNFTPLTDSFKTNHSYNLVIFGHMNVNLQMGFMKNVNLMVMYFFKDITSVFYFFTLCKLVMYLLFILFFLIYINLIFLVLLFL
jgi:hypothetical protein